MADATPLRVGQVNVAGATDAMFLKVFAGEVMTAFDETNVVMDKHIVRTITSGKSAAFPATWKVTGGYHTPGTEIVGQTSPVNERVILIDDLLIASVFIPNIDEAKNHFEYRSEYSRQAGLFLANNWDKNVLQVLVKTARISTPTVTGGPAGTSLTSTGTLYKTSASDLVDGLYALRQGFDEKDIPDGDTKYAYLRPAQYYLLAKNKDLVDRDYSDNNGDYAKARLLGVADCALVKTNHLPTTNITTGPSEYQGDFTKTACVVATKSAAGTVKLLDLATEMDYDIRRQGHLIVAKYAVGHGTLRPECAGELKTTS